mmetsp:Transcript_11341/g.24078  ORF Transcript_11341/g.24078 Transcript_11341/m.24078 type:complete len:143 (+) Transcript_11341:1386-1814(+)
MYRIVHRVAAILANIYHRSGGKVGDRVLSGKTVSRWKPSLRTAAITMTVAVSAAEPIATEKKYNTSAMSGMSVSNMSLGFEEESNLSAHFDQSMKLTNARASERSDSLVPLGMSLEPLQCEKSSSSMSTDSSLVLGHVFDDK